MRAAPYLSVVVTARNDDHGGNLLGRMQAFVNACIGQCARHGLAAELIIVDWNPPEERPRLVQALHWPGDFDSCRVRFIEVPPAVHARFKYAASLPLYQMIAKNVGIRRARGRFVLATNIDIIFSDELVRFLAERRLEPGRMYRMDRHDAMSEVPVNGSVDEMLAYCRTHLIRINAREGSFKLTSEGRRALEPEDIVAADAGVSFGRGWFPVEPYSALEVFRWAENDAEILVSPRADESSSLALDLEPGPGAASLPLLLQVVDESGEVLAETKVSGRQRIELTLPSTKTPLSFRLRVAGKLCPVAYDPRILIFRVFHCGWHPTRSSSVAAGDKFHISAHPLSLRTKTVSLAGRLRSLLPRLAQGGLRGAVLLPVPASVRRWARFYFQAGGLAHAVSYGIQRQFRSRILGPGAPQGYDIFEPRSGIDAGVGWYPQEHFLGETFRWVRNDAELVMDPVDEESCRVFLIAEPGPGVSCRGFELVVRNSSGEVIARHLVPALESFELLLPRRPGRTEVFSLGLEGGGSPAPGDPRILNFRVFWCGRSRRPKTAEPAYRDASCELAFGVPAAPGTRWGAGWATVESEENPHLIARDGAEVVIHPSASSSGALSLDLEPVAGRAPFEIEVRDQADDVVATVAVRRRERFEVPLPLRPGRTQVFRLHVAKTEPTGPAYRIYGCGWINGPGEQPPESPAPVFLHTNGCGDFTLMAREHWFELRGYPEFDLFSMNLDSVLCYAAHHAGFREEVLPEPMRIYHIEHGTGSGWTPEGQAQLYARLSAKGLPWLDYAEVVAWASQMRRLNSPMIFNRENWGLAELEFQETEPEPQPLQPRYEAAPGVRQPS